MRKLLIFAGAVVFLAAACNSQAPVSTNNTPKTAGAKIDAAVEALNRSVDAENSVNMQSDMDVFNADQAVINNYNGVSNASSY